MLRLLLTKAIKAYQRFAPKELRGKCRFSPSCSEYALIVLSDFQIFKAIWLIARRLVRCRPPNGGIDNP
jgi:putative membrane protein insertion efficiency factor